MFRFLKMTSARNQRMLLHCVGVKSFAEFILNERPLCSGIVMVNPDVAMW